MPTRTTLAAATVLAVGALLGFDIVRGGAQRASVGSTEASDGRLARVGRIDRSNLGSICVGVVGPTRATRESVRMKGDVFDSR